uniref:Shroom family member 1 n=1 Tax=Tetraodon nigroviridis TaxID=99883 RepID=H3DLG8_TETNG
PLGDIGSERINKETTPLLYHLTGASRAALQPRKEPSFSTKNKELNQNETTYDVSAADDERPPKTDTDKNISGDLSACNTLDDSFKKYYKEKLKDAQSKVLRATSFKRKDLQLSWPHRIRAKPEMTPPVVHTFSSSQDSQTSTETLTPSLSSEETETGSTSQPQVVRIGGKKRLTPEERKKCYSEPEKLNQLGSAPFHSSCRSFGNESENAFAVEDEEPNCEQQGEPGLVAARRKMFETKGQDFSVPAALKPSLKHLQQKALAEYMERKTGHRVSEQQQPGILVPPSSRHRHSLGEKPFDWGPKLPPGNQDGKNSKKKLHRPHSAGRVLDSPTTSVSSVLLGPVRSPSQPAPMEQRAVPGQVCLSGESAGPARTSRFAEEPVCFHTTHIRVKLVEATSLQKMSTEDSLKKAVAEGRRRARVVAQRGKSMEELGTSKITRLPAISKSSEQLDRVQGQERDAKAENVPQQAAEEPESVLITQGPTPHQTQRKSPFKQHPEPGEDPAAPTGDSSGSTSPASPSASGIGLLPGSHGPASDTFTSSRPPSETLSNPPSPRGLEDSGCGGAGSFPPSPTQTKPACESRCPTRSEREESVDDPNGDSGQDVLLTCGVTTDPSLWNLPPEESSQTTESLFHHETAPLTPPDTHAGEASVPDRDASEPAQDEKNPEGGDEEPEERQETEERGTSEGEAKAQRPMDRLQWEELVEAVVAAEPSLARVMYPLANRKTALMLMEQLLSEDTLLMEEHYKKKQELQGATDSENAEVAEKAPPAPDKPTPACPTLQNKADVAEKKVTLISSHIEEHLRSLEEMRGPLQAEVDVNAAHGAALELLVQERCLPLELERYSLFIGDLERVVNLLLCLSARLARVQNALSTVDQHTDAEEKQSLDSRHRLLCKQREDAKDLKDNLDRRENVVSTFLSRQLSAEQLQDYRRFVQTKASLLIRQKDLEEKQRLGEEQLEALSSSLNL